MQNKCGFQATNANKNAIWVSKMRFVYKKSDSKGHPYLTQCKNAKKKTKRRKYNKKGKGAEVWRFTRSGVLGAGAAGSQATSVTVLIWASAWPMHNNALLRSLRQRPASWLFVVGGINYHSVRALQRVTLAAEFGIMPSPAQALAQGLHTIGLRVRVDAWGFSL